MTLELSLPAVVAMCSFTLCFLIGIVASFAMKDKFFVMISIVVGLLIGGGGYSTVAGIQQEAVVTEAEEAIYAIQQDYLTDMPEDWQQLYKLINTTDTAPLRQAYVIDFLKDKTKPEISANSYEVFYNNSQCMSWSRDYCIEWKLWLAKEIGPFALIDTKAAMGKKYE